jgi:glycosyltransferase involved in cell wall biosynthesis
MTLWIDATTAATYPPPTIGIPRVELNLAEQLCAVHPDTRVCLYEARPGRFSELPVHEFARLSRFHRLPPVLCERFELALLRHDYSSCGGMDVFKRGDVLISCGFNWRPQLGNMDRLYAIRRMAGLRLITMCHDIIAIKFPHFVPGIDGVQIPYLRDMARNADHILCNSRATQEDLLHWLDSLGTPLPQTSVMPMGSELQTSDGRVSDRVGQVLAQRFLLSVSTIESRKNHRTLYQAYAMLIDRGVNDLPLLAFAGAVGHGGQALIDEIAADTRMRGRLALLSGVSDNELAALYKGCVFTLYPSLYEGWGLPVSESLACGKFCLASNQGALAEAGEAFVEYLNPTDVEQWANTIDRYLNVPSALAQRERDIRNHYRPKQWHDAAAHVLKIASGLGFR